MKTLILHLGLQKTGSTSIQETLRYNPDPLARAGFRYASITWPDGKISSNHSFPIVVTFSDGWQGHDEIARRGWTADGLRAHFSAQIDQALETSDNLILSGEDITDIGAAGLAALAARAQASDFDIAPVMLVRPPLEFITSMSQTRIRHGHAFHVFQAGKSRRIAPCLDIWPDMTCLPFAEAIRHPEGPLGVVLRRCGLNGTEGFNLIRQNDRMSDLATRLIGHVNSTVPLFIDGAVNPLRTYLDTEPLTGIPGPRFLLTRNEFLEVRPLVQAENQALAQMLGPAFCDPDFRFAERPAAWTHAAMTALAEAMTDLSPPLQAAIRRYFSEPGLALAEDRALAQGILG